MPPRNPLDRAIDELAEIVPIPFDYNGVDDNGAPTPNWPFGLH